VTGAVLSSYADGAEFVVPDEIATIDESPNDLVDSSLSHADAIVLHYPVSLKTGILREKEFFIGCQIASVNIQVCSTHRLEVGCTSSVKSSTSVLGMHIEIEAINETEYDADADADADEDADVGSRVITESEEVPYNKEFSSSSSVKGKRKLQSDSETAVASFAGGNNEL
jgi:hypothetical protein